MQMKIAAIIQIITGHYSGLDHLTCYYCNNMTEVQNHYNSTHSITMAIVLNFAFISNNRMVHSKNRQKRDYGVTYMNSLANFK